MPKDWLMDLHAELEELERTDPVVAAAAASYDETVRKILRSNPVSDEGAV